MEIIRCSKEHYDSICAIYNYYIENTVISFEEETISVEEMAQRIEKYTKHHPWLVGVVNGEVLGYAYATYWQARSAYSKTVEVSCYMHHESRGKGMGVQLYRGLIEELKKLDCHVVIAGVALPNPASEKMQERSGFKKVAHYSEVGFKFNQWIDVGYWQLNLK